MAKHRLTLINAESRKAICSECGLVDIRFRTDTHKWRCQSSERHNDRKRKYDLSRTDFESMILTQDGKCGICGSQLDIPHVDHDHLTGRVRGLLCSNCNTGIGLLKDDIAILAKAIVYLMQA